MQHRPRSASHISCVKHNSHKNCNVNKHLYETRAAILPCREHVSLCISYQPLSTTNAIPARLTFVERGSLLIPFSIDSCCHSTTDRILRIVVPLDIAPLLGTMIPRSLAPSAHRLVCHSGRPSDRRRSLHHEK